MCVCVCVCVLTCMHDDTYKTTRKLFICCLDSSLCVYWGDASTRTFLTPTHMYNCFSKSLHILPIYRLPCKHIHTYIGYAKERHKKLLRKQYKGHKVRWSVDRTIVSEGSARYSLGRTGAELTNCYGRSNILC